MTRQTSEKQVDLPGGQADMNAFEILIGLKVSELTSKFEDEWLT